MFFFIARDWVLCFQVLIRNLFTHLSSKNAIEHQDWPKRNWSTDTSENWSKSVNSNWYSFSSSIFFNAFQWLLPFKKMLFFLISIYFPPEKKSIENIYRIIDCGRWQGYRSNNGTIDSTTFAGNCSLKFRLKWTWAHIVFSLVSKLWKLCHSRNMLIIVETSDP